ncbi:MAG: response regulator [Deltaproteobacteria bacterium]
MKQHDDKPDTDFAAGAGGRALPAPSTVPPAVSLMGLRVLLVEDDPDARELVSAVLERAGADVQSEASADEGFDAMLSFRPQLLVSDIAMPDQDGYSLVRRIRALDPRVGGEIPCLALTAFTRAVDRERALAAGFTAHLGKPVDPARLVATVGDLARCA